MSRRIFICSTCYDLIDVRAELAAFLRSINMEPVLSEEISGFRVEADQNSIDTCLVNVRSCERVIVILNQRYGRSLGKWGFDDISPSHLEYRTAMEADSPVDFFVRDRMEADFNHWKRETKKGNELDSDLDWVMKKDFGLFDWLAEHKELNREKDRPNWYYSFSSSVDLKARVSKAQKQKGSGLNSRCGCGRFAGDLVGEASTPAQGASPAWPPSPVLHTVAHGWMTGVTSPAYLPSAADSPARPSPVIGEVAKAIAAPAQAQGEPATITAIPSAIAQPARPASPAVLNCVNNLNFLWIQVFAPCLPRHDSPPAHISSSSIPTIPTNSRKSVNQTLGAPFYRRWSCLVRYWPMMFGRVPEISKFCRPVGPLVSL